MRIYGVGRRRAVVFATLTLMTGFGFLVADVSTMSQRTTLNDSVLTQVVGSNQSLRSLKGNEVCSGLNIGGTQQPSYCTGPLNTPCIVCVPDELDTPLGSAIAGGSNDPKTNLQDNGITKPCNTFAKRLGKCLRDNNNKYYCGGADDTGEMCEQGNYKVYGDQPS